VGSTEFRRRSKQISDFGHASHVYLESQFALAIEYVMNFYFILRLLYDNIITIRLYVMYASLVKDFPIPGEA
jgi:hypothetical protein